jgi:hypothetical protein
MLVEGMLFDDHEHQSSPQGLLLIPGRFIAFRRLNFDAEDEKCGNTNSPAALHLHHLRGDDEVAGMLHRLPDYTYLDEIPLRSGDTIVWRDVAAADESGSKFPQQEDESYLDDAQYYQNKQNENSFKNNNNNNHQYRSDRNRILPDPPALSVEEYDHRQLLLASDNNNTRRQQSPYVSPSRYQSAPSYLQNQNQQQRTDMVGVSPLRSRSASPYGSVVVSPSRHNNQQNYDDHSINISNNRSRGADEVNANLFPPSQLDPNHLTPMNNNSINHSFASSSKQGIKSPPPNLIAATSSQMSPERSGSTNEQFIDARRQQNQNQMSWITSAYPQRKPYDEHTPSSAELLAFELRRLAGKDEVY